MSSPLLPPPNFLEMALQAGQARRQAEQDRLQQLMMLDKIRESDLERIHQGIQMGGDVNDLLKMSRLPGDPYLAQQAKAFKSIYEKSKAAEAAAPTASTLGALVQAGGSMEQRPASTNEAINQNIALLQQQLQGQPELLTQALLNFGQAQDVQNAAALAQQRVQADETAAQVARAKQLGNVELDVRKRASLQDLAIARDAKAYDTDLADAQRELASVQLAAGGLPTKWATESILKKYPRLAADPSTRTLLEQGAEDIATIEQDARSIFDEYKASGVRISPQLAKKVSAGGAARDRYTGLVFDLKPGTPTINYVRNINGALANLSRLEVAAEQLTRAMAEKGIDPGLLTNPTQATLAQFGDDLPEYGQYVAAKSLVDSDILRSKTGVASNADERKTLEKAQAIIASFTPDASGALSDRSKKRLRAVQRNLELINEQYYDPQFDARTVRARQEAAYQKNLQLFREEMGSAPADTSPPPGFVRLK